LLLPPATATPRVFATPLIRDFRQTTSILRLVFTAPLDFAPTSTNLYFPLFIAI
jgi:hypothetical protein